MRHFLAAYDLESDRLFGRFFRRKRSREFLSFLKWLRRRYRPHETLHALERLRDLAYVGGFQKLYVHSPDRLARRYAYQVLLVDELKKHGVDIVFLNRAIGVSPEEDLLLQVRIV